MTLEPEALLSQAQWLDRWQDLHGGYDPRQGSAWVRRWLSLVHSVARPLARTGVHPDLLTLASLLVAGAVLITPSWAGVVLVLLSALIDGLDGCVAVLQQRTSRWGYLLDSVVDRCADIVLVLAMVQLGAPGALGAGCGFAILMLEYVRARAGNAGSGEITVVTVGERPTRVIVAVLGLATGLGEVALWVLTVLTGVAVGQLLVALRRTWAADRG